MGIGSMIESTAGVCSGRAHIAGTRVAVHRIAGYYRLGYSPEEILTFLGSLSLYQIYAALAHALANGPEMDAALREEQDLAAQFSARNPVA